jgi:hypothetical protein
MMAMAGVARLRGLARSGTGALMHTTARAAVSHVPGLMMDYPLTLDTFLYRAERVTHNKCIANFGVTTDRLTDELI